MASGAGTAAPPALECELGPSRASHRCRAKRGTNPLYTVGHWTRTAGELVKVLLTRTLRRGWSISAAFHALGPTRSSTLTSCPTRSTQRRSATSISPRSVVAEARARASRTGVNAAGWERQPFHNYADYAETEPFHRRALEAQLSAMAANETCAMMCAAGAPVALPPPDRPRVSCARAGSPGLPHQHARNEPRRP